MDTVDPLRFIFAFLFVIGLIGLSAFAMKRFGRKTFLGQFTGQGEGRIRVLEMRYLDRGRKLLLIRRDHVEHLLLLSDNREIVIESWEAAKENGQDNA